MAETSGPFPTIAGQCGLATRRQLHKHGWTESTIRHQLGKRWQLVFPGVVAPHCGPVPQRTRQAGAALWAGRRAVLSGSAGLILHGLESPIRNAGLNFLVPQGVRSRQFRDARAIRTDRWVEVGLRVGCVAVASAERCLADAVRWSHVIGDDALAVGLAALQQELVTSKRLTKEILHGRRNHMATLLDAVETFDCGAWSRPESVMFEVLSLSPVIPTLLLNPRLTLPDGKRLPTPDGYIPEAGLAIQVHSRRYHSRDAQWQRTVETDAALTRAGITVLGVTPLTLYREPERFRADAEETYRRLVGRPIPELRITPRAA